MLMENIKQHLDINKYKVGKSEYKNHRDFLIKNAVKEINKLREGTNFKKETAKGLAIRINQNPFLSKDDGELEYILSICSMKGNYSRLYWILRGNNDYK